MLQNGTRGRGSMDREASSRGRSREDILAQTFPLRTSGQGKLSFSKLAGNRTFHKAIGAMRRHRNPNATIAGTRHVISVAKWRHQIKSKKRQIPPGELFRRYIKLTVMCIKLCKTSYESLESVRGEYLSVSQYSEEFETAIDMDGLVFDPSEFKANKKGTTSLESKRILQTSFGERTEKDIDHLMVALKSIQSFKEYPRTIQRRLCQVGWYESFGPKRAIIRQGHPPRSFYFILSGTVVVSKFDKKTHDFQILVFLQQGMSFGELAVIKRGARQATVSSKTSVELLCISVADYRNIFMSGTFKNEQDSEMNQFIRNIGFMKKFPIHILGLEKNQEDYVFHYFHRGQILARDTNNSDWIFIIKSGSVSVLRKLREVKPNFDGEDDENDEVIDKCQEANRPFPSQTGNVSYMRRFHKRKARMIAMSELAAASSQFEDHTFQDKPSLEKHLTASLPGYFSETEKMGLLDYDSIIEDYRGRIVPQSVEEDEDEERDILPYLSHSTALIEGTNNDDSAARIRKTSKGVYLAPIPSRRKISKEERRENDMEELRRKNADERMNLEQSLLNRKTMADELDNKPQKYKEQTEADLKPMFIEVKVLERGQYFGVGHLVYGEQPSLSLVSNGAECIMISKKFFQEHAPPIIMDQLRQSECPFPPEDEMQTNLQDFVNWKEHRQRVYQRLVQEKQAKFKLKKSYLQQYTGQYSFRTGPI